MEGSKKDNPKDHASNNENNDSVNRVDTSKIGAGTPTSKGLSVTRDDKIREIKQWVQLAQREEESKEQSELKRRRAVLEAAIRMRELVIQKIPKTTLYAAVGISRQAGRLYMFLAHCYREILINDVARLSDFGQILSINQAEALQKAQRGLSDENSKRLLEFVRKFQPLPKDIMRLVHAKGGEGTTLATFLEISEEEIAALRKEIGISHKPATDPPNQIEGGQKIS